MKLTTIIQNQGITPQKLLVPKNSGLQEYRTIALQRLGIMKMDAALSSIRVQDTVIDVVEQRAENIPEMCDYYTDKGIIAFGLTGDDLVDEYRLRRQDSTLRVIDTTDWFDQSARYGRPTLCFIGRKGDSLDGITGRVEVVVNRKYEKTSAQYLKELSQDTQTKFSMVVLDGAIEEAVVNGVGRYAIEMVYSGKSIEEGNLDVLYLIRQSDVDLVTSWPARIKTSQGSLDEVMCNEFKRIEQRLLDPTDSETSRMLQDRSYAARKLSEEAYEVVEASLTRTGRIIPEAADLVYKLFGVCVQNGAGMEDLAQEMSSRQQ